MKEDQQNEYLLKNGQDDQNENISSNSIPQIESDSRKTQAHRKNSKQDHKSNKSKSNNTNNTNKTNNTQQTATSKRKSEISTKATPKRRKKSTTTTNQTTTTNPATDTPATEVSKTCNTDSKILDQSDTSMTKNLNGNGTTATTSAAGHRPVTSCTHCRQHKIKCNASEKFPDPCSRCQRMNLKCEIDPQFRPKKGSQIQSLRNDVDELRSKIEYLSRNENLIAEVLQKTNPIKLSAIKEGNTDLKSNSVLNPYNNSSLSSDSPSLIAKTHLNKEPILLSLDGRSSSIPLINDSASNKTDLNPALEAAVRNARESPAQFGLNQSESSENLQFKGTQLKTPVNTKPISQNIILPNNQISEFILGDVKIDLEKAQTLHKRFVDEYLPFLPIMVSNSPIELYQQSQLLFWTVMLTACQSDPEPSLYTSFASLIKQLAIETCWIRTPRSTHIVQSLLILGTWPLPNQKVLDDCSYRFIGLAKSLSLQLGLHRGKFMTEFSRTQVALPDAEKWRSRTWLAVFFCEQFWSSNLGLPPSLQTDYLLENARIDNSLPKNFRCLISLSIFQAKLVNVMGLNVSGPDGLMEPANRAGPLYILERELQRLAFKLQIDDLVVEIYYLYVKLMVCQFSFLPETPSEDQTKYVNLAYHTATRIVTIMSKLVENKQLTEYPIYVRHSVTTAAFVLFRLHLTPYLLPKYIDSARQSIVTVHRLFRNMLAAWKDVENDISRTATVLEKLNFVIITHPELFTDSEGIIVRMRSHLTGSLFYDLVWNIHEARRRTIEDAKNNSSKKRPTTTSSSKRKPLPLPFYNQITKDDFTAISTTTPNGTTITTLVPTDQAIINAKESASKAGLSKPIEINGIPLAMLEATGSLSAKKVITNEMNSLKQQIQNPKQPVNTNKQSRKSKSSNAKKVQSEAVQTQSKVAKETSNETNHLTINSLLPEKAARLQRSTSMNAAANGMIPPPLFPLNSGSITRNFLTNTSETSKEDVNTFSSGFKAVNTNINNSINVNNSNSNCISNDNKSTTGLTPVSFTGFENFFDSPAMSVEMTGTPPEQLKLKDSILSPETKIPIAEAVASTTTSSNSISPSSKLQDFQTVNEKGNGIGSKAIGSNVTGSTTQSPTDSDLLNEMFIDSIFQQNLTQPNEDDDLLGWFDMNMAPEF